MERDINKLEDGAFYWIWYITSDNAIEQELAWLWRERKVWVSARNGEWISNEIVTRVVSKVEEPKDGPYKTGWYLVRRIINASWTIAHFCRGVWSYCGTASENKPFQVGPYLGTADEMMKRHVDESFTGVS